MKPQTNTDNCFTTKPQKPQRFTKIILLKKFLRNSSCLRVFVVNIVSLSVFILFFSSNLLFAISKNERTGNFISEERIASSIKYLSSLKSRMPGYPGNALATSYILKIFKEVGLSGIKEEQFPVTVPVDQGASLQIAGQNKKIKLYSLWPNLVRTSTLPEEGIEGNLVYGGSGHLSELKGKDIEGNIILLDFNSGSNWVQLGSLGAKAIIFIEPSFANRNQAERKFLKIPLNLPRFWTEKADAEELIKKLNSHPHLLPPPSRGRIEERGKENSYAIKVKLHAKMEWQKAPATNILGWVEGTDRELKKEIIVLESYYDSISAVPSLAPGAENACGIATLLELARFFGENPPKRTVLFLATSAHFMGRRGIDAFLQSHCRNIEPFQEKVTEPIKIKLFIGLDLSSRNKELAIWHNSEEFYYQRYFAPFGKKFDDYGAEIQKDLGLSEECLIDGISPKKGIDWSSFMPEPIKTDGALVLSTGTPALSFVTINDNRILVDTPSDRFSSLNLSHLTHQVKIITCLLQNALNDPKLFPASEMVLKDNLQTLYGKIVTFDPRKSFVPNEPVKGAIAVPRISSIAGDVVQKTYLGVRGENFALTDEKGEFEVSQMTRWGAVLEAYLLDPVSGEIILAPDRGVNGDEQYPMNVKRSWRYQEWMIVLFPCIATNIYGLIDPQYLTQLDKIDIFNKANSVPDSYGYSIIGGKPWEWTSYVEPVGVVFSQPDTYIKVIGEAGPLGKRLLFLNSPSSFSKEKSEGEGFLVKEPGSIINPPFQAASDAIHLNAFRMENFKRFGIANERLMELHKNANAYLKKASRAREEKDWENFIKYSRAASGIESRAYPDVKGTANDVIKGLIFYFLLLLPFAYFSERLIFGFVDVKKQIMGVFGIFLLVYFVMRFVHPGFKLTNAPEVILLAFIALALSIIVLSIITSKFEELMDKSKKERAKVYETDVGRITATGAAFTLGVANMKRRKLRTFLTSITLILLTFTVLSFTSIKTYLRFNQIPRSNTPLYEGALVRDRTWSPLEEPAYDYVFTEFKDEGIVCPRAWYISKKLGQTTFIKVKNKERSTYAYGLLGLTPQESEITHLNDCLLAGRWFRAGEEDCCILPDSMAKLLAIKEDEIATASPRNDNEIATASPRNDNEIALVSPKNDLEFFGQKLKIIGIIDSQGMEKLRDLDDERITPVNFSSMAAKSLEKMKQEKRAKVAGKGKIESFVHLETGNVLLVPYKFVMENNGTIASITVKFHPGTDTKKLIEDFVSRLAITLFAGIKGKTSIYSSLGMTSFSGIANLFIPILIAALIVLNTMLGAVYERIKEIGTYSSVGLAPVHIGALFMAESCVYAVLGAVAGYLLGQVVTKILIAKHLLAGLTLNYSSLSAVIATIIVIAVVLLSTVYPARKASQMAVPDVTRKWVLPKAKGDNWEFDFPFTVSEIEVLGLCTFLKEYFLSYGEESIGTFYTKDAKLSTFTAPEGKAYFVETTMWLAPFDLGVSQQLKLSTLPMGKYQFYTIRLSLKRLSGETTAWTRLNRRFLDIIRKQFLVWRTVSPKIKAEYKKEGEKII